LLLHKNYLSVEKHGLALTTSLLIAGLKIFFYPKTHGVFPSVCDRIGNPSADF
jgi:hypothetical protein